MVLFVGKMGNFPRPVPVFNQLNEIRSSWWTFLSLRRTRGAVLFPLFRAPTLEFVFSARPHPGKGTATRSGQSEALSFRLPGDCRPGRNKTAGFAAKTVAFLLINGVAVGVASGSG